MSHTADLTASRSKAVLVIAGSDPSGGAGIQADLKTLTALGVYGAAAITCITVQNTKGVFSFQPLAPVLVRQQIERVLQDLAVSHIKIGMVGSPEICSAIGEVLINFSGEMIYDPVLRASTGQALMTGAGLQQTPCSQVVSRATVLTPNLNELAALTGRELARQEEIPGAARQMLERFPRLLAIIVKGGHGSGSEGLITDYMICRRTPGADISAQEPLIYPLSHPRIQTRNDHGTGCTFASAFTAFHLLSGDYLKAFEQTVSFMNELLDLSVPTSFGGGRGAMAHHLIPQKQLATQGTINT